MKKDKWPGFRVIEHPDYLCFACWVGLLKYDDQYKCYGCPISVWVRRGSSFSSQCCSSFSSQCCSGENNTFELWNNAITNSDYSAASKFAMIIAEYEWELEEV